MAKDASPALRKARKRVIMQASLTMMVVVLTIVLMFAMSAAWYTNIVHTNGLTFQVEAWGFDGEIVSSNAPIVAGPGDEGLIQLEVASESDSISSVSVGFHKNKLDTEMQKRLYFFVDQRMTRNEELMERVYISSQENYTYKLFSQGKLTLTETVHNDSQLKWQWVYDVLGYYVRGTKFADGQNVLVTEYLRPIEYDYDKATMELGPDGQYVMKTVDGTTTMDEYMVQVSLTDGYPGQVDPEQKLPSGYYPVVVDDSGKGIYAYLCTYSDIERATQYDTLLGQDANLPVEERQYAGPYEVTMNVSAQKDKYTAVNVTTLASLQTALNYGPAEVVTLASDITIGTGESLMIAAGRSAMLDMNGHKLICSGKDIPVIAGEGASLTMLNGTIECGPEGSATYGLKSVGAEVTLSGVQIDGFFRGIHVCDSEGAVGMDTTLRVVSGSKIIGDDCGILIYGNGDKSEQKTQVIIEDSLVHSNDITICGNGNTYNFGTDVQIVNSTVTSNEKMNASAIYQPQRDGQLTIYNSTISGYTGIALKGGTASIFGSTVRGLGQYKDPESFNGSGFNGTGDAIYIETNYNYEIELNIGDMIVTGADGAVSDQKTCELTSTYGYSLQVYDPNATHVRINITGGVFSRIPDKEKFMTYVDENSDVEVDANLKVTVSPRKDGLN